MPTWLYPSLLHAHRACVGASIALFMARGLGVSALCSWPMQSFWRSLERQH